MRHLAGKFHEQRGRTWLFALEPAAFIAGRESAVAVGEKRPIADMQIRRGGETELKVDPFAERPVGAERA